MIDNRRRMRPTLSPTYVSSFILASLLGLIALSGTPSMARAEQICFTSSHPLPAGVDQKTGFRMQRYRAAVPDSLPGGCVVDNDDVIAAHLEQRWLFVDVYPPKGLGPDPLNGDWIVSEKHSNIEGSVWWPEVGRGFLEKAYAEYFRRNLVALTNDNKQAALLFYCTSDCWQSWNAAQRAIAWGYTDVYWYPAGIDGWQEGDHSLVAATATNFLETP